MYCVGNDALFTLVGGGVGVPSCRKELAVFFLVGFEHWVSSIVATLRSIAYLCVSMYLNHASILQLWLFVVFPVSVDCVDCVVVLDSVPC